MRPEAFLPGFGPALAEAAAELLERPGCSVSGSVSGPPCARDPPPSPGTAPDGTLASRWERLPGSSAPSTPPEPRASRTRPASARRATSSAILGSVSGG